MKRSDLKELIKKSMHEVAPKGTSGAMTPEEEAMVAGYEEEVANKYALDNEKPLEEEKKGHYVTVQAKDGSHKSTLTNLPNHADQTYRGALQSIERLKAVDGRKGKKYVYYVSDKDGNPITQGKEIEEEKKGHYVTVQAKDGSHKSTLTNLPNHADQTYRGALQSIERLKAVDGKKGKKYIYYVSDIDGNPIPKPLDLADENVLREADEIVAAYAEKKTLKEEMHGGYLELLEMNPDFEQGARLLLNAWFEWKEGPMTEPYMVEEAKQDILAYLSSMMK